ncbi:M23 family metallopeptidase [Pseudonocardia humida]|uniref:M23 family metallopeptidase n=1 Tax=Pseudonocardia humida TaxID=2800819 RepID=A0ABT0ZW41_9PSEU|nr:M23 family metallopeptidase [Pseudonocardia humida]MCO1654890.1 M23 family metallopeptidase [Pseudonocardia humida]
MVAAVAAGGVVAAGQTLAAPLTAVSAEPIASSTLLPVAETRPAQAPPINAIGGDQLPLDPLALGSLDGTAELDVQNLTKAVDIGQELARQASLLDAARADGAKQASLVGNEVYVNPTEGRFTSGFGSRWGTTHQGIDIAGPVGTPIYALTEGVVEEAGPASGFGLWVVLRHPDGTQTVYGHVNRIFVEEGQRVDAGEEIAEMGNKGHSTGPHLHFEVWDEDGTKLNPLPWLQDHGITP